MTTNELNYTAATDFELDMLARHGRTDEIRAAATAEIERRNARLDEIAQHPNPNATLAAISIDRPSPIANGTRVEFDIAQGQAVGVGVIRNARYDEGWLYEIEVLSELEVLPGSSADDHRNEDGQLWVCEFEVHPLADNA